MAVHLCLGFHSCGARGDYPDWNSRLEQPRLADVVPMVGGPWIDNRGQHPGLGWRKTTGGGDNDRSRRSVRCHRGVSLFPKSAIRRQHTVAHWLDRSVRLRVGGTVRSSGCRCAYSYAVGRGTVASGEVRRRLPIVLSEHPPILWSHALRSSSNQLKGYQCSSSASGVKKWTSLNR